LFADPLKKLYDILVKYKHPSLVGSCEHSNEDMASVMMMMENFWPPE
jgi:hypothetical protein